jgi:hypothetical protein
LTPVFEDPTRVGMLLGRLLPICYTIIGLALTKTVIFNYLWALNVFITFGLALKVEDGLWARERWFFIETGILKTHRYFKLDK